CKGFSTEKFLEIVGTMGITWFSAVPTILQAIAKDLPEGGINHRLRFIRSGSASLPFTVAEELERVLGVTVVEAYATTETVLISSNPVDMNRRKQGSAGIPRECEVEIRNSEGTPLGLSQRGEIWVRGPLVMKGYENDEEENARVLVNGWYRTGDEGYFDEEGYLYITGRIKETINRGGEKISPGEIDEVLLSHPEVVEAAAFPFDHSSLGEDIAAAVVLTEGSSLTEVDLKSYTAARLSFFKIPSRIVTVQEIPKGPTGKFVRHSLSELIVFPERVNRPAETDNEKLISSLWKDILGSTPRGTDDDFFESGGNSILAARLVSAIENRTGVKVPIGQVFMARTLGLIGKELEYPSFQEIPDDMVLIKKGTRSRTLYCFPFNRNGVSLNYGKFSSTLAEHVRVVGIDKPSYGEFSTLEEDASDACDRILQTQPEGPFRIMGFCYGGPLALKTSMILEERGHEVFCCLIDFPFFKKSVRHYLEYGLYFCLARNKLLLGHVHSKLRNKIKFNAQKFQIKTFWSEGVYFRNPCLLVTGKFIHSRGMSKAQMKASMKHFENIEHIATDLEHLHMLDGPASIEVGRIIGTWLESTWMPGCRMGYEEKLSDCGRFNERIPEKT
ncbi:MAG: AMP-binding protein, partial [Synergistales bacterium]|nr:AMP-binding protein [Synergistales bacterium]